MTIRIRLLPNGRYVAEYLKKWLFFKYWFSCYGYWYWGEADAIEAAERFCKEYEISLQRKKAAKSYNHRIFECHHDKS